MQLSTVDNFMETCTVLCVFTGLQNPASRTSDDVSRAFIFSAPCVLERFFRALFFSARVQGVR